jgi:hypothetical protein
MLRKRGSPTRACAYAWRGDDQRRICSRPVLIHPRTSAMFTGIAPLTLI